jgi:hypothetical protein
VAVDQTATGHWLSVAAAATELGLPERAVYRQIATRRLRARRDERGALLVCLDGETPVVPGYASASPFAERETLLTPDRARALSEFATALMDPLISRLAEQEAIIRSQSEELGRLRSRDSLLEETEARLAPTLTRQLAELAAIREEIELLGTRRRWWPF